MFSLWPHLLVSSLRVCRLEGLPQWFAIDVGCVWSVGWKDGIGGERIVVIVGCLLC